MITKILDPSCVGRRKKKGAKKYLGKESSKNANFQLTFEGDLASLLSDCMDASDCF